MSCHDETHEVDIYIYTDMQYIHLYNVQIEKDMLLYNMYRNTIHPHYPVLPKALRGVMIDMQRLTPNPMKCEDIVWSDSSYSFLLSTIAIWITPLPWDPMGNSRLFSSFLFTLIFTTSQLGPVCALARTNTLRCPQLVLERPTSTWVSLCLSLPQGSLTSHDYKQTISNWKRFKLTTLTEDQQPITIFPEWMIVNPTQSLRGSLNLPGSS